MKKELEELWGMVNNKDLANKLCKLCADETDQTADDVLEQLLVNLKAKIKKGKVKSGNLTVMVGPPPIEVNNMASGETKKYYSSKVAITGNLETTEAKYIFTHAWDVQPKWETYESGL
ncbi:hypothetical protein [Gimesia maris]|uniref:hypothetical protein n=1 Tax=Gimesia maris TaxID=122 RepID=UPI003A939266